MSNWNGGYLGNMRDALSKQVFVVSNWEGDDWWLTKYGCSGSCQGNPTQTIKNISIKKGAEPGPKPDYDPSKYTFGDACAAVSNCKMACDAGHCKWSWPKGSTWSDPNADCRCDHIVSEFTQ